MTIKRRGADRARPPRRRDDGDRRPGEHPVLPRARRLAAGHRRESALRRRLSAADGGRLGLPRARARARARRAPGAASRRVPGGRRHDAVLLAGDPRARPAEALEPVPGRTPDRASYPARACGTSSPARPGSSARISPRRLPPQGNDVAGIDCFTDYYDPALEGGERARPRRPARSTSPRTSSTSPASTASSTWPASRACAASATSSRPTSAATCSPRSASSRRRRATGVRVVFASSSSVYGAAERYPTPEDTAPQPLSPYGITKLACEHLAAAYAREFGLDCVVLRYFNAFGPRQRPDMAFTRIVNALAAGIAFELYGDGDQSRGWTYVARRRRRHDRGDERRHRHLQRRRRARGVAERDDRAARADLGPYARRRPPPGRRRRPAAHERRHDADQAGARLGAVGLARGRSPRPVGVGRRLELPLA